MLYPVAIIQKDNQFFAQIPDLPELAVSGSSMADTVAKVRVAIIEHLQNLSDDDKIIPAGQELSVHLTNPAYFGYTWAIISLDSLRFMTKALPLNINVPRPIIKQIQKALLANQTVQNAQEINALELEAYILDILKQHFKSQ